MNKVTINRKNLSNKTIIICGIVRDCAINLSKNINTIEKLCMSFKDYQIVLFENDSKDNTKSVLQQLAIKNKKVHISINTLSNEPSIPESENTQFYKYNTFKRIERMAYYRNKYIEYIEENNLKSDYIMVVDLDVSKIYFEGIISSFNSEQTWDVITANGYALSPKLKRRYFDTYALYECGMESIPQTSESLMKNQFKWGFMKNGMPLFKVYCAHGGISIYRYEVIKNLRYTVIYNNDKNIEVRCEHYGLMKQIHEKGYHDIYINPSMLVKYRGFNFRILIIKLKELFK